MPIWDIRDIDIDVDAVLRGQGAQPEAIRKRNPRLVEIAERALEEGYNLLEPAILYRELNVKALRHEQMVFESDLTLSGRLVSNHLGPAEQVVLILCTIGETLEAHSSEVSRDDLGPIK